MKAVILLNLLIRINKKEVNVKNDRKPNLTFSDKVDNFIGIFSPVTAARRRYFRYIAQNMLGTYRGAEGGRLRGSWAPGGGSADQDLLPDLATLRERSRDLVRNDGIAAGAVHTIVTNIIGSGVRPQSRVDKDSLSINEDYADQLQKLIEKIWERWASYADAGGRMDFYQLEELSERQRFVNGESIIIPIRILDPKKQRPYSFALQTVEADRLNTPNDLFWNKNIRSGVEVGEFGEPLAYYIRKVHPGDIFYSKGSINNSSNNYNRYEALNEMGLPNVFHLYQVMRSGQTRGEPFFAPVINLFKDRFEYMEAELVAARVAACFAVFIKKQLATDLSIARSTKDSSDRRIEELSPGLLEYLEPGEDIQAFNPQRPGGTFGIFMERILRDVSAGLNIPYEILAKDFTRSNYSNMRASLLEARRFFMMQQRFVSIKLCQPVLITLIEEAYLKGELPILDFYQNRAAYVRTRWVAPGWEWIDPQNEVAASVDAINNNLSTLAEEAATQGRDWEDDLEQRARELKKIKELEKKFDIKMTNDKPSSIVNKAIKDANKPQQQGPNNEEN